MARRRNKKVGSSRIDVAIGQLTQMGFSESRIRRTVNSLLKVYGDDSGWVFIEDASYKVLIDTILEEQENKAAKKEHGWEVLDTAESSATAELQITEHGEGEDVRDAFGTVREYLVDEPNEETNTADRTNVFSPLDGRRLDWKDITCLEQGSDRKLGESEIGMVDWQPLNVTQQPEKRKPCYGWISSEFSDDEDDYVFFETAPSLKSPTKTEIKRERKTRWDVKPGDM